LASYFRAIALDYDGTLTESPRPAAEVLAAVEETRRGGQKIVLVVEGECAPAPLSRLITPTTLVIQTDADDGLEPLARWSGAAVAAWVPASAARFVHDPAGGVDPWRRLTVHYMPEPPRHAVGGLSPGQQAEDLRQLAVLAAHAPAAQLAGVTPGPAAPPPPTGDPVDRLAAWLLQQANLADLP